MSHKAIVTANEGDFIMLKPISKEQSQKPLSTSSQLVHPSNFSSILTGIQTPAQHTLPNKYNNTSNSSNNTTLDILFEKAAATYNVPLKLLKSVAKAESGFNSNAVSSCGAQGIMQLMPQTSAEFGVNNPFDPEQNIMGGAKCLAQKLKTYHGDIKLTLASYNAGSGNVRKYGGIPPFPETKHYVEKVLNYMKSDLTTHQNTSVASMNTLSPNPLETTSSLQELDTISHLAQSTQDTEAVTLKDLMSQIRSIQTTARMLQYQSLVSDNAPTTFDESDYQKLLTLFNH